MDRFICIHGHFYQPPRENPWLEAIELQDSAAPYHDWNERVTAECYAPNAHARLLDGQGRIERIVNNYSRISFDFGPTLLSWMKENAPDILEAIVAADKESRSRFGGHGSALAQCYNHIIMPLATRRDKVTQTVWGIRDFELRFGRAPEGMWLPETAADNETLDVLAEHNIKFTILSPFQASRTRPLAGGEWLDVNGGRIDPSMPYRVNLKTGRSIAVFFYDAPLSRAVAFERLLDDGKKFASRLTGAFDDTRQRDQLSHIATDGESYGHHHHRGEMALAYALHCVEQGKGARLTVYAEHLEDHPPTREAEIHEPSAWSCPHGVDRWRRDCGCNSGGHPGWTQGWRGPLRQAIDWLRGKLGQRFEEKAKAFFPDPWSARDRYISALLNRSPENIAWFFAEQTHRELGEAEQVAALRLLEMERHALLMQTSCGWFFDEITGLESTQVIQYAARAIQLAGDAPEESLEPGFLEILEGSNSNLPQYSGGRHVFEIFVKPAVVTRESAAVHFAVSSLFETYPETSRIYSFTVVQEKRQLLTAGNARLAMGRIKVTFEVTRNTDTLVYGALHMGDHNLNCGVLHWREPDGFDALAKEVGDPFSRGDFPEVIRAMDRHFGGSGYSLKWLFRDGRRKILGQILGSTLDELHNTYQTISDRHAPLLRFLAEAGAPIPPPLHRAIEFALNRELLRQFEAGTGNLERTSALLAEVERARVPIEAGALGYAAKSSLDRLCDQVLKSPEDEKLIERFAAAARMARLLPFEVNLWRPQNTYYNMAQTVLPKMREQAACRNEAKEWTRQFAELGERLGFGVAGQNPESRAG